MLHKEILEPSTLELLKSLQDKDYLKGFCLVGGTALALYFGHRRSADLDLFTNSGFDAERLLEQIHAEFDYKLYFTATNTLKGNINGVNVDIIAHRYPYLEEPVSFEGIVMLSLPDILAMKLNALAVSGQRSKDFIDIYYSFQNYSLDSLLRFYRTRYSQKSDAHILKSLVYFDEVDLSDWPVLLKDPGLQWEEVMKKIETEVFRFTSRQ